MPIEPPLLDILACPIDKHGLLYFEDEAILYNPRLRRIYRLADDHLIMLAGRAEPAPAQEHERLLKRARHGDAAGTGGMTAETLAADGLQQISGPGGPAARTYEAGGRPERERPDETGNGQAGQAYSP